MDIYIPLALYIFLVSFFFQKKKNLLFILVFVPLLLFFGTRVDFGVDYETYLQRFELQHDWDFDQYKSYAMGGKFEPGFWWLIKVFPNFNSLVFFLAMLILVPLAILIYEFIPPKYYPLAFLLYLINPRNFESFIAMRSGVVVGLLLIAILLKYRGYKKISIAVALFSGLFHMSGYFLVPFFLISDRILKKNFSFFSILISIFIVLALISTTFYGELLNRITESIDELSDYKGHVYDTDYGLGFYIYSLFRVAFVVYILSLLKKGTIEEGYVWIAWMTIFGYFFNMVQGFEMTYRYAYYFYLISIPFKCYVLRVDKTSYSKMYVTLSVAYLLYYFVGYTQLDQVQQTMWHYKSFLF